MESPIEFTLTVESDDLADMLGNPQHLAKTAGTLTCAALSAQPVTITNGAFNLFVVNESDVDERNMNYTMTLVTAEGKTFYLTGQKIITRTSPAELRDQTNTLYAEIRDSAADDATLAGKATLIITPENFICAQRPRRASRHARRALSGNLGRALNLNTSFAEPAESGEFHER